MGRYMVFRHEAKGETTLNEAWDIYDEDYDDYEISFRDKFGDDWIVPPLELWQGDDHIIIPWRFMPEIIRGLLMGYLGHLDCLSGTVAKQRHPATVEWANDERRDLLQFIEKQRDMPSPYLFETKHPG